ncbi:hypothetical protein ACFQ60_17340 [Streptomyces zhihengii]
MTRRAIGVLRAAGYAVLPAELALVFCLVTGARVPGGLLLAVEAGSCCWPRAPRPCSCGCAGPD